MPSQLKIHIQHDTPAPALSERWHTPCYDNLNKLEWQHHFSFECYGSRISVRSKDFELLEQLRNRVPEAAKPYHGEVADQIFSAVPGGRIQHSRVRTFHMLYQNHTRLVRSRKQTDVISGFETWVPIAVAACSPDKIFVHAGVVALDGKAIVIPGRSHSGKTTLVRELVRAGAEYYSDEFAVIDDKGCVHPYPKPLSVRAASSMDIANIPVTEIGGRQAEAATRISLVILANYKQGAYWRPRTLSSGEGVLGLISNTVAVRLEPARSLRTLATVSEHARIVRSARGDASEVAERILKMTERLACVA
ncbi:hypothetical protein H0I76_11145 [Limibaculum sp. M0105]|uniref:Hpr(Ser) kinase/phosphatase n=1 Tax=Thermohalobaculum xanthum TaxID=2753746 RepID=A0A8J7SFT9_9RHOB|nr:hypothetical protein [Thermohalobaculum xanthum]MBK0399747.1 hypothetical protein [Thermohalobaculum xanthum]